MSRVRRSVADGVAAITLDRPERHNSLVPDLLADLQDAIETAGADPDARCVLLAASGRTFSTGGDLRAFRDAADRAAYADRLVGLLNGTILAMIDCPRPLVAAVHGLVTGGSLGLILACDVVVAAADATFRPWYATVGFAPDGGWTALLPSVVGRSRAAEVLLTDREITADEALEWGLAHRVVPAAEVPAAAARVARRIASLRPGAVAAIRRLTAPSREEVAAALEDERRAFVALIAGEEASAGLDAFLGGDSR